MCLQLHDPYQEVQVDNLDDIRLAEDQGHICGGLDKGPELGFAGEVFGWRGSSEDHCVPLGFGELAERRYQGQLVWANIVHNLRWYGEVEGQGGMVPADDAWESASGELFWVEWQWGDLGRDLALVRVVVELFDGERVLQFDLQLGGPRMGCLRWGVEEGVLGSYKEVLIWGAGGDEVDESWVGVVQAGPWGEQQIPEQCERAGEAELLWEEIRALASDDQQPT